MSAQDGIAGLGSPDDYVGRAPGFDAMQVKLEREELLLFALVGRSERIGEVLSRCGLPEAEALAALLSLRAKGAIRPTSEERAPTPRPALPPVPIKDAPRPFLTPSPVALVGLSPERREEALALEKRVNGGNFFEILGVPPSADRVQIRNAYHQASLKFHPDRYFGQDLGDFRAKVELIFRKLTEAHGILSDDAKRAAYLKENPRLAAQSTPDFARNATEDEKARGEERRSRLAKHPYLARVSKLGELLAKAKGQVDKKEFDIAIKSLVTATQMDPTSREAHQLLIETRRAYELSRAKDGLAKGRELERTGNDAAAITAYRTTLSMDPSLGEAAYRAALLMARLSVDLKEALSLAQKGVELSPKRADAWLALGMVNVALNHKKAARGNFQEALNRAPEHSEAKKQLKGLKWVF